MSPAPGAAAFAAWLRRQGFEVKLLTDKSHPVHSYQVEEALRGFVTGPERFELLVVYFAGHGYWQARNDRWLLSEAPERGSDAINLNGAIDLARYSGIKTVVFISDACRSIPDTDQGQRVEGIDAFPNLSRTRRITKVDYFKATSESQSAFEVKLSKPGGSTEWVSVLTGALRAAYREATPDMILEVTDNEGPIQVVPNRRLEAFLQPKVDDLLAQVNPTLSQQLDISVPSDDGVFIGRVARRRGAKRPRPRHARASEIAATAALDMVQQIHASEAPATPDFGEPEDYRQMQRLIPERVVTRFESECGFTVAGAKVSRVATTGTSQGARVELLHKGGPPQGVAIVRVWPTGPATSVVGVLQDGQRIRSARPQGLHRPRRGGGPGCRERLLYSFREPWFPLPSLHRAPGAPRSTPCARRHGSGPRVSGPTLEEAGHGPS